VTLSFLSWVTPVIANVRTVAGSTCEVRNQLDRASLSILLNIAEGNGKRQGRSRACFFDDARGSVTECAACLDAMVAKGFLESSSVQDGKEMLVRVASMLTKLVDRFSGGQSVGEEGGSYSVAIEDEYEDDDEYEGKFVVSGESS